MALATKGLQVALCGTGAYAAVQYFSPTTLRSLLAQLTERVDQQLNAVSDGGGGDAADSVSQIQSLLKQIQGMQRDISRVASRQNGGQTIVLEGRSGGGVLTYAVPLVVLVLGAYGYLQLKGLSLKDFMYVTQKSLSGALSGVQKKMEGLSASLQATRRQLTARLDGVAKGLEEDRLVQSEIRDQVGELKADLGTVGLDIESMQRMVQNLEFKIEEVTNKQDITNRGVYFLCSFVTEGMDGRAHNLETIQGLRTMRMDRCSSLPANTDGRQSLKGLQLVADALKPADENSAPIVSMGQGRFSMLASGRPHRSPLPPKCPS